MKNFVRICHKPCSAPRPNKASSISKLLDTERQAELARSGLLDANLKVRNQREGYAQIVEQWNKIKDDLRSFQSIYELEASITSMEQEAEEATPSAPDVAAPRKNTDEFAEEVGHILKAWGVPGCKRVFFDPKENDLQLDGKLRGSQGKGLRALTHAAFIIGLMTYCIKNDRPHPGFVIIDFPLLSFREDEVEDDPTQDLKKTTVDAAFYRWLANDLTVGQVIIIENRDAPGDVADKMIIHEFVAPKRYGFFPQS